jgi:DNA repair protein RadC
MIIHQISEIELTYRPQKFTTTQITSSYDAEMIFQAALKANAHSIILAHNHPSGNLEPSQADISLTKKVKEAGAFLEIPLIDHLILTSSSYVSLSEKGYL